MNCIFNDDNAEKLVLRIRIMNSDENKMQEVGARGGGPSSLSRLRGGSTGGGPLAEANLAPLPVWRRRRRWWTRWTTTFSFAALSPTC